MSLLAKYRQRLLHEHGWQIELECSQCGHVGLPKYDGWTPKRHIRFRKKPTIYANVACPECSKDLKKEAGNKLVELFSDLPIPPQNKRLIYGFVLAVFGLPLVLFGVVFGGVAAGWWDSSTFLWLSFLCLAVPPTILLFGSFLFTYKLASIRHACECGEPKYLFMGRLGHSRCYSCSTCGRLLRVQD